MFHICVLSNYVVERIVLFLLMELNKCDPDVQNALDIAICIIIIQYIFNILFNIYL